MGNNKMAMVLLVFGGGVIGGLVARVLPAFATHNDVDNNFDLVPFRGRLEKGELPHSAAEAMKFSIYDAPANGNLLYVEDFASVQPDPDGNFAVVLGRNGHAADGTTRKTLREALRGSNAYYVGVAVAGVALEGRQRLVAAPFAARVAGIKSADIDDAQIGAGHIADAGVRAQHIAAGQVGSYQLADGGIGAQHLSSLNCAPGQFAVLEATGWECRGLTLLAESAAVSVTGSEYDDDVILAADDGRTFCFLTQVRLLTPSNFAQCFIVKVGNDFAVRAHRDANNTGGASCRARCLKW